MTANMYHQKWCLWLFCWPLAHVAGQSLDIGLMIQEHSLSQHRVTAQCGWVILPDNTHPERPRQIVPGAGYQYCLPAQARHLAVHAAQHVTMLSETSTAKLSIRATALEDGSIGKIIRCRSIIDGTILFGKIIDDQTLRLDTREGNPAW